ncbi:MAG: hypothetical protein KQ78_01232 [Candidatus Izimaplasma bacterium HR2]|nr:MAG: hypothetical protein KQ78_01232 [Candidatus Izimaplasma bacterium HR2]
MKIIDAHIHFSKIKAFEEVSKKSEVDYSLEGFKKNLETLFLLVWDLQKQMIFSQVKIQGTL